jgi:HEAT repeat protein
MTSPANDTRSVADLWEAALQADDDTAWDAVAALHWRGSKEVLDRAVALTRSGDPAARARGADVLGQLGLPERTFPEESFSAVLPLLRDEVLTVVCDAVYALQHVDREWAASHIIPFAKHGDVNIRHAVAFGLGAVDTPEAQEVLLKLMTDRDADVRYEGIIGLGRRRDSRAVRYLKLLLHEDPNDIFAREATAKLLGLSESRQITTADLLGALQRLQRWSGGSLAPSM